MTSISLEMDNTLTDCDKGYIDVRCVVNGESDTEITSILLNRIDANDSKKGKVLAEVSKDVLIKDLELSNRAGEIETSYFKNVSFSYLSIKIMGSVVNSLKDKWPYQCNVRGFDTNAGFFTKKSMPRMLNITGNSNIMLYFYMCSVCKH